MMTRLAPCIATVALIALGTASAVAVPAPVAPTHTHVHAAAAATNIAATTLTGYNPPVAVVASGDSVSWTSTDAGHNQRETSLPSPVGSPTGCFSIPSTTAGSASVTFTVTGGAVTATVGSTTTTCLNAVSVGGAAFVVPYHCTIHANMNGFVVVTA